MQILCKYYVELSRYREATCFIREGLDLTQCHYCTRRLTQFLLHQINTDLIASNLSEATARIDLAETLICEKATIIELYPAANHQDIIKLKNSFHLNLLRVTNVIKNQNFSECFELVEKFLKLRASLLSTPELLDHQKQQQMINIFNELFIEIHLNLCNALKLFENDEQHHESEKEKQLAILINYLKQLLIDSKSTVILNEKWYLAEYNFLLYELNPLNNLRNLKIAFNLIKFNPQPNLYRKICQQIFSYLEKDENNTEDPNDEFSENDVDDEIKIDKLTSKFDKINFGRNRAKTIKSSSGVVAPIINTSSSVVPILSSNSKELRKCAYLLDTQSIALRHKACSIHIKNKRKSAINLDIYENLVNVISFNKKSLFQFYFTNIQTQVPSNWTIISLIMNENQLYLVRIERNLEPFLFKLQKFSPDLIEKFKKLIAENDESMKQNDRCKFWSLRNQLNKRLIEYLNELDDKLFNFARYFLIGSYSNKNVIEKCEQEIKLFYKKFVLSPSKLTLKQKQIIYILFNVLFDDEILNEKMSSSKVRQQFHDAFSYAKFSGKQCESFSNYLLETYLSAPSEIKNIKRKHVCLLIDKCLHQIPWECLTITRNQTITRMPSMHFLIAHLQTCKSKINKEKAFYIVDPGGDLQYTKTKFEPFFERQIGWSGISGKAPDEAEFKKALTEYDLFV